MIYRSYFLSLPILWVTGEPLNEQDLCEPLTLDYLFLSALPVHKTESLIPENIKSRFTGSSLPEVIPRRPNFSYYIVDASR